VGDDIFFMTFREVLEDDRSNVARNREVYESYRNFKAPNEIGARWTSPPRSRVSSRARESSESGPGSRVRENAESGLRGITASHGDVQGFARVARSVEEAAQIEEGAILVCPFTDPGWTPILGRVRGVITETGGLLSHAAIICREYGIPALLSVPDATSRIPDRSQIHLRASLGCVEILPLTTSPPPRALASTATGRQTTTPTPQQETNPCTTHPQQAL
jgi:pyruvate,water dikinase